LVPRAGSVSSQRLQTDTRRLELARYLAQRQPNLVIPPCVLDRNGRAHRLRANAPRRNTRPQAAPLPSPARRECDCPTELHGETEGEFATLRPLVRHPVPFRMEPGSEDRTYRVVG